MAATPISRSGIWTARQCLCRRGHAVWPVGQGKTFLGGIMKHASALGGDHQSHRQFLQAHQCAAHASGATWSPNTVTWTGNNRTHMVRVPGPGRFELRLPDGAVNPYLLAGRDHCRRPRRPPDQCRSRPALRHRHVSEGHTVKDAPQTAAESARCLARLRGGYELNRRNGNGIFRGLSQAQDDEWNAYAHNSPNGSDRQRSTYSELPTPPAMCRMQIPDLVPEPFRRHLIGLDEIA